LGVDKQIPEGNDRKKSKSERNGDSPNAEISIYREAVLARAISSDRLGGGLG